MADLEVGPVGAGQQTDAAQRLVLTGRLDDDLAVTEQTAQRRAKLRSVTLINGIIETRRVISPRTPR